MAQDNVSEPNAMESVNIRNNTRNCLSFRVPGQSVLLMPNQTVGLPRKFLDTHELNALIRQGYVFEVTAVETVDVAAKDGNAVSGTENSPQEDALGKESADVPNTTKTVIES